MLLRAKNVEKIVHCITNIGNALRTEIPVKLVAARGTGKSNADRHLMRSKMMSIRNGDLGSSRIVKCMP